MRGLRSRQTGLHDVDLELHVRPSAHLPDLQEQFLGSPFEARRRATLHALVVSTEQVSEQIGPPPTIGEPGGTALRLAADDSKLPVIEKILTHLGLQARALRRAPPRGSHLQAGSPSRSNAIQPAPSPGLRGPAASRLRGAADRGLTAGQIL